MMITSASPPEESGQTGDAPQWQNIPFDVNCGRCGTRLNGVTAAGCPTCQLHLDWDQVLPVDDLRCEACDYQLYGLQERRCPECGQAFEWPRVLERARSKPAPVFESLYVARPISSLAYTYLLAIFGPAKLWRLYDIHAPVRIVGLLMLVGVQWLIFGLGWPVAGTAAVYVMNKMSEVLQRPWAFTYVLRGGPSFIPLMAAWYVATFLSLQIFVITKHRFRIRWQQILRVYVHCTLAASLAMLGWCFSEMLLDCTLFIAPGMGSYLSGASSPAYLWLARIIKGLALAATWVYLWYGYHAYLKVPRGWGVAALSMILGFLLARAFILMV